MRAVEVACFLVWVCAACSPTTTGTSGATQPAEAQPAVGSQPSAEDSQAAAEAMGAETEDEARAIAEQAGREAGYDLDVYRVVAVERIGGSWRVSFEHAPPAPPGGHFSVNVDAGTGAAQLRHGR